MSRCFFCLDHPSPRLALGLTWRGYHGGVDERTAAERAEQRGVRLVKVSYQDLRPDGTKSELRHVYWLIGSDTQSPDDLLTIDDVVRRLEQDPGNLKGGSRP
jgi:hypothetical protein